MNDWTSKETALTQQVPDSRQGLLVGDAVHVWTPKKPVFVGARESEKERERGGGSL